MFFIITPTLICGAFAERLRFASVCWVLCVMGHIRLLPRCPLDLVRYWLFSEFNTRTMVQSLRFCGWNRSAYHFGVSALICDIIIGNR